MMDFFFRNPPKYREARATPQQPSTGLLSSFWCYLFGDDYAVCYRHKGDETDGSVAAAAPTVAPRRWSALGGAPAYKTSRTSGVPAYDSGDAEPVSVCASSDVEPVSEIFIE